MSMQRRVVQVFGGVVFIANAVVLVSLAILTASGNVESLLKHIPPQFLTSQALLIYMFASVILLKYGSEGKGAAAVRLRCMALDSAQPMLATNIGESEANEVVVLPIEFDTFPWRARSPEIGSVNAGPSPESVTFVIERREDRDGWCRDCLHISSRTLHGFLDGVGRHIDHMLETREAKQKLSDKELEFALSSNADVMRHFQVFFRVHFYSGRGVTQAQHRLDISYQRVPTLAGGIVRANCVFLRKLDKGEVVRIA